MEFLMFLAFPMMASGCFLGQRSSLSLGIFALTLSTLPWPGETTAVSETQLLNNLWKMGTTLKGKAKMVYNQYAERHSLREKIQKTYPFCNSAYLPHPQSREVIRAKPPAELLKFAAELIRAWVPATMHLGINGPEINPHERLYNFLWEAYELIILYFKEILEQPFLPDDISYNYGHFVLKEDTHEEQLKNAIKLHCFLRDMKKL
ncbi:uncharacterized protein LOC119949096 isoform X2 [Tachyglossus aculeatus]|uniref:uncharacterized protein LOC119949096 isoform X2 n=1 Tax=Tachyglossus aculeatus TaxID=9261 RepID=UPI0018F72DDD|nr:uncharacterized protein LOC119949096 isoform X2 [Tachyglossus aculeatus]